ncbi:MAG: ATP-dependent RecD-like DNA helicase, partial [Firmicutes bacterium]|nr:ATP-dependent RecD-like DNA helicase [Bacillota bacterium]
EEIICRGIIPEPLAGESLKLTGAYKVHPVYGEQFEVEFCEKHIPETIAGMERYLASGVIKGIGAKTARRIVERFGESTFYIIEEKPSRLAEIKGITHKKAMQIAEIFSEQAKLRQAMMFLQSFGVSTTYASKIYKKYQERTIELVKENPYRLAEDIHGIGFKMADRIAANAGISPESPHRIKSALKYVLTQAAQEGHTYLPEAHLIPATANILGMDPDSPFEPIENALLELLLERALYRTNIYGESAVYLDFFNRAEGYTAKKLLSLRIEAHPLEIEDPDSVIDSTGEKIGISLAEAQRTAVMGALQNGVFVITGGPGTGKTTIINTIIRIFEAAGKKVALCAPTGRAAKRMSEATGSPASTIHRLLGTGIYESNGFSQQFEHNEDNPLPYDVIIVDETSMVDILLMQSLLKAIPEGAHLIFVGDADQLPSVGAGNVLKDMILSEKLTTARLTEVFRQAAESDIVMNAHRINKGEPPVLNRSESDFFLVRRAYAEEAASAVTSLVKTRLPAYYKVDAISDIQVLTPMRKGILGVEGLNRSLQAALNPPSPNKAELSQSGYVLREGDKVMQIKNNYSLKWKLFTDGLLSDEGTGIFNGDIGRIMQIDPEEQLVTVLFDDGREVFYEYNQLEELELSYAVTIHKSQGSEYPVVVLPLLNGPPMLMTRNLLYTAITRAKNLVVVTGLKETLLAMIENNREIRRYSGLAERIIRLDDFLNSI